MDWNDLKYILAISEYGSLNAAARELGVNHSTVYRRVQNLQSQLGVNLVVSSPQGYQLSNEGVQLLPHAKAMAAQADAIALNIGGQSPVLSGLIRITAPGELAAIVLPSLLAKFQNQYPEISFELLAADAEFNLSQRQADIAIRGTGNPPEHLVGKPLEAVELAIFANAELAAKYQNASIDELYQAPWVGLSEGSVSTPAKWVRKHVDKANIRASFNSVSGCVAGCLNGMGLAFLPVSAVSRSQTPLVKLYQPEIKSPHQIWILMPKELKTSAKISTCYRFLIDNWPTIAAD